MNRTPGLLADGPARLLIAFARQTKANRARMLDTCPACGANLTRDDSPSAHIFGLYLDLDAGTRTAYVLCGDCADALMVDAGRVTRAVEVRVAAELADDVAVQA